LLLYFIEFFFYLSSVADPGLIGRGGLYPSDCNVQKAVYANSLLAVGRDHRNTQQLGEGFCIDVDMSAFGHVNHVERDDNLDSHFQELDGKVQVPLQVGRVHNVHNHIGH